MYSPLARIGFVLAGAVLAGAAAPGLVRQERRTVLHVEPLVAAAGESRSLGERAIEIVPGKGGALDLEFVWPSGPPPSELHLAATGSPGEAGADLVFGLQASVIVPGAGTFHSSRSFALAEGSSGLFEVFQQEDRHLVLAVRAEAVSRPVAAGRKTTAAPISLRFDIERREGERTIPLETNHLSTFVGEGVEYAFRQGSGDSLESVRVLMTPVLVSGEVAEIEVEVSGTLPAGGGPLVLSRRERLFTSRRATSALVVVAGTPPAGYCFRITPDF